ncbi:MAG: hypothetical protein GY804_02580 [Alphaproteobacteria bacterium]|nr:hypothetical protein [Alphaproteobacteria bacterium]
MKYPEKLITYLQEKYNVSRELAIEDLLRSGTLAIIEKQDIGFHEFIDDFEMSKEYQKAIDIKRGKEDVS